MGMLKADLKLLFFALGKKPDLMAGTSYAISHVGKVLSIPSINVNEDDWDVVPFYARLSYPWASVIISPRVCRTGKWQNKKIEYDGYHELAYLHPNYFSPDKTVVRNILIRMNPFSSYVLQSSEPIMIREYRE